jgi:CheY-like chemotaxis protein
MSSVRMNPPRKQVRQRAVSLASHAHAKPVALTRALPHKSSQRSRSANAMVRLLPRADAPADLSPTPLAISPVTAQTQPCILIVEDDPCAAHAIRDGLALEGEPDWNIQVAEDGERALALAAAQSPNVVLLNVGLPDFDGAEVYRRLRAHPETWKTHMLFLTAATSHDLYQHGVDAGVVLRKPFEMRELVGLVRTLVAS